MNYISKRRLVIWILCAVIITLFIFLFSDFVNIDFSWNDEPVIAPTGNDLIVVNSYIKIFHLIEFFLQILVCFYYIDIYFIMREKYRRQNVFNKATLILFLCLIIYVILNFIENYFMGFLPKIDYSNETYGFNNYGDYFLKILPELILITFISIINIFYLSSMQRTLNLRGRYFILITPLIGIIIFMFSFVSFLVYVADFFLVLGSLLISGAYLYIAKKTKGITRQKGIYMGIGFFILVFARIWTINPKVNDLFWNGSELYLNIPRIIESFFMSFILTTIGYFIFKRGITTTLVGDKA